MPVTALDVREIALRLPRAYEAWVRDYRKFRVGRIVFATVSPDETELGFGFPREEREDLVAAEPEKFFLPRRAVDLRYQWVCAKLAALDLDELEELIIDAWTMCVPAFLAQEWFDAHPRDQPSRDR